MKKNNIFLIALILLFGSNACDERFEEVNTNPNGVSDVDPSHIFANGARSSFRSGVSGYDYKISGQLGHYYVGVFVERFIDQYKADLSGNTYESLYDRYKDPLKYYNEIMLLTAPGLEKENPFQYATADVMAVLTYAKLTDAYGDIPYYEGGFGNSGELSPAYDSQRDIYMDMLDRLTADIEVLKTAVGTVGLYQQDPVCYDDPDQWVRFANSIRLRLAMRIRHVEPSIASDVITTCIGDPLLELRTHNIVLIGIDGDNSQLFSPWYGTHNYYHFKISDKMVSQLNSTDDPRLPIFATPISDGSYKGFVNGLTDTYFTLATLEEHSEPGEEFVGRGANSYLMTASEVAFRKAECALFSLGGLTPADANGFYQDGIELCMDRVGVAQEDIDAFMTTPAATLSGTEEEQFEQVCTQLWIAFMPNVAEGYSMMRRTGYPVVPIRDGEYTDLGDTEGELPSRSIYPLSERLTNSTNVEEAIDDMGGEDITKTRVWWDVQR